MTSSTESGLLPVPTKALYDPCPVLGDSSEAAGVQDVPRGAPHGGETAWLPWGGSLRQDFSIPLSPKA